MSLPFPEPSRELADPSDLFVRYLDYFRSAIRAKLTGLSPAQLTTSVLPSGWTPMELLVHLVFMERRWLRWGFLAEDVEQPWGDHDAEGSWRVPSDATLEEWLERLDAGGRRTREIVQNADLASLGALGGRFKTEDKRPTLAWILFHVLQEYARHAGHLDVARELIDGEVGE